MKKTTIGKKVKTRIFRLTADCEFRANNIDEALMLLSKHFRNIIQGRSTELEFVGNINLEKEKDIYINGKR